MLWVAVRDSLWFLPAVLTVTAGALALLLIEIEQSHGNLFGEATYWLWEGGAEGTRGVLTAIASSLITVTGVVFSVTIVALQLASSQFTPRLLRNFTADRSNQAVLGVLIGTFTYSLLVLRAVQSESDGDPAFIPRVAAMLAVVLVLISIGFLIYFIDHASKSIQLSVILDRVTRQTKEYVANRFPHHDEEGKDRADTAEWEEPEGEPYTVTADSAGYLQAVGDGGLVKLARERQLWIRMEPHIGQYLLAGRPVASVWPADVVDGELEASVRKAFVLGHEPTPEQDIEFGVVEIADIAIKALSPSVNDPTTALRCLDRLAEILVTIGERPSTPASRYSQDPVRFRAMPLDYERIIGLAFDQIRHYGASNPTVARKMVDLLSQMISVLPPHRHAPLQSQLSAIVADARDQIRSPVELAAFERMLDRRGLPT